MANAQEVGFDKILTLFSLEEALIGLSSEDEFTFFQDFVTSLMKPSEAKRIRIIWGERKIDLFRFFLRQYNGTLVPAQKRREAFYIWLVKEYKRDYPDLWMRFEHRLENGI